MRAHVRRDRVPSVRNTLAPRTRSRALRGAVAQRWAVTKLLLDVGEACEQYQARRCAGSSRAGFSATRFGASSTPLNFARIHKTLRVTPAMEAGVADHVWSLEEIAGLA